MKSPISSRNRKGFTLIELLTVIAIIGILAAVLFPGVQGVMKKAKQSAASTKLRNIAQSYITFNSGSKFIKDAAWNTASAPTSATTLPQFAAVLALNAGLNSGEIWYVDADPANESASFPKQVLLGAAGAEDVLTDEEGAIEVLTTPADFEAVKNALEAAGLVAEMAEVTWRAENSVSLSGDDAAKMQKLLDILEDLDDVQNVFHNAELED